MEAYRHFVSESLVSLQSDASICRNCPRLTTEEGSLPDDIGANVRFRNVNINHHRHYCNARCVYCPFWNVKPETSMYAITPVLESLVEQHALHPNCCIGWGGGEPTLLPDFEACSVWLRSLGYRQYVHTNAIRCSDAVLGLLREGKGSVNISLDSHDARSYAAVKGVDAWDKVLSTIRQYRAACAKSEQLEIKYIIFEENNSIRALNSFFALCRDLDIRHVQYSFHGDEMTSDRLSPKSMLGAAFFVRTARTMGLKCHDFYLPESYSRQIEQMSREL